MARRIDYYDDPDGPKANSMVPIGQRRRDQRQRRDSAHPALGQRQLGRSLAARSNWASR